MMWLRDAVQVITARVVTDEYGDTTTDWGDPVVVTELPAQVSYATVANVTTDGRNALIEELRAIVEPYPFDPLVHRLRWRGQMYTTDGPPMVRRRNGEDHHLTIPLRLVTG